MVNDLRQLLSDSVASPPHDDLDLGRVVAGGRRRVRRRRASVIGGTALATAAIVVGGSLAWPDPPPPELSAAGVPKPDAPLLRLADAEAAVEGTHYRVLTSYTNEDLNRDNGQYLDGVTDDGLVLFRDGPRHDQLRPRHALLDPATGEKDWLPRLDVGQETTRPVELGEDRLVLLAGGYDAPLTAHVLDRSAREWTQVTWPDLPVVEELQAAVGPDDRLYVSVPATRGQPPPGGWPTSNGEADDADAEGSTYQLWSASLTDSDDVRDEGLTVGQVAFTDSSMVWTDSTNGDSGMVHVRDLESGQQHSFDPHSGERCNLLSFGATDDRIVMGQYCGTYRTDAGEVRDDRIQVLSTEGDQVVTLQDTSIDGGLGTGGDVVTVSSYERGQAGTYVYDLATGRFLRLSDDYSQWATGGGPVPGDQFMWTEPANGHKGATQLLGELID